MDSAQQQLIEKVNSANNILVTVSANPTVDQLAACIGLTLLLNKLNKHATAVFSGEVPSTLEFLKPEGTIEKNTDSLRDFIIAIDKSKADKLRYKLEDQVVRIFITPYRTSISQSDLEFSQGDFNVDLVIALGVTQQIDLDSAITAHGRILHDATVSSITLTSEGALGSINWHVPAASSLSELIVDLSHSLGQNLLDNQIATALLTGVVAETERFRNEKTTPRTMSASAELLAAGADQQLVATKLDEPTLPTMPEVKTEEPSPPPTLDVPPPAEPMLEDKVPEAPHHDDGTLEIAHEDNSASADTDEQLAQTPADGEQAEQGHESPATPVSDPSVPPAELPTEPEISLPEPVDSQPASTTTLSQGSRLVVEPPTLGGTLTANSRPEALDPSIDPLGDAPKSEESILSRSNTPATPSSTSLLHEPSTPLTGFTPPPPAWVPPSDDALHLGTAPATPSLQPEHHEPLMQEAPVENQTSTEIPALSSARDEVEKALLEASPPPEPITALNAAPLGDPIHPVTPEGTSSSMVPPASATNVSPVAPSFEQALQQTIPVAPTIITPTTTNPSARADTAEHTAPPVPPPIPYRFGNTADTKSEH